MTFWVAGAVIGSAVIGGVASNRAANTQAAAANQATQTQWDIYNQNRTDMQPWRDAGANALGQLTAGISPGGQFSKPFTWDPASDPGYQFRMDEGQKAIERSRAARGGLYGGATGKALERYGQDYASNEYTNSFNRYMAQRDQQYNELAGISGTGQTATQQVGQQGVQTGAEIGQNIVGAGNARASGYVGGANAISGGVGQYLGYNNNQQWLNYLRGNSGLNYNYGGQQMTPYGSGSAADNLPPMNSGGF